MFKVTTAVVALGLVVLAGAAHAQGFTGPELERMSRERLDSGAFRNFSAGAPPPRTSERVPVRQPQGLWVCMSTAEYVPILAEPRMGATVLGQSSGQVAAGTDRAGYTSVLYHEGKIGWLPKAAVRPYRNEFNPRATCTVAGLRADGLVMFDVR